MRSVHQGDIIRLEQGTMDILVLSRDFFNQSGMAVVCPICRSASEDALHIPVSTENYKGIATLEHLKSMDLRARHYRKAASISYDQIQNISDAVQGIFDYFPYR